MNIRECFHKTMSFQNTDRIPVIEWASWWDKTLERWHSEGLPEKYDSTDIMKFFGLDVHKQFWMRSIGTGAPKPIRHGAPIIREMSVKAYAELKPFLFPADVVSNIKSEIIKWAKQQQRNETIIWLTFDGFFWYPRTIFGIEEHMYSFYDAPDLMHNLNEDLVQFMLNVLDEFCEICVPDFITLAEDMSYNLGPMISEELFDEFLLPYYRQIIPELKKRGIHVIIDSDGDITKMIPWFKKASINGFLPLERQAGVDIAKIRETHQDLIVIGGFDKMVMHLGEEAIRKEFERLLPVMRQGGFIPSCDHQTPPQVSMKDYKLYVSILREYCDRASSS